MNLIVDDSRSEEIINLLDESKMLLKKFSHDFKNEKEGWIEYIFVENPTPVLMSEKIENIPFAFTLSDFITVNDPLSLWYVERSRQFN